ncbi:MULTISPECIES: TetR/AcrR family transcriptional regulator [unclassified Saccharothrix]|uniref:TetR/AcrR family transcriptional regulator n=1 Tax=unclassified Saccharothrix TaxID=2593673 RepID=UPI00307D9287
MTQHRQSRAEKAARTRVDLLDAAARVFARKGYSGASVGDIAEEAGYTHGAVYSQFRNKQDLFFALYEQTTTRRAEALAQVFLAAEGTLRERMKAVTDWSMVDLKENPDWFLLHMEFLFAAARDPEVRARFSEGGRTIRNMMGALIQHEVDTGALKSDMTATDMAMGMNGLFLGLALQEVIEPGVVRVGLYGDVVRLIMDAMSPEEQS